MVESIPVLSEMTMTNICVVVVEFCCMCREHSMSHYALRGQSDTFVLFQKVLRAGMSGNELIV